MTFRLIPLKAAESSALPEHEFCWQHTFPTKTTDDDERQREQHAAPCAHSRTSSRRIRSMPGGIGWCAFDYNTHCQFRFQATASVITAWRIFFAKLKAAGRFLSIAVRPAEEVVLEPAFHWARGDEIGGFNEGGHLLQLRNPQAVLAAALASRNPGSC